MGADWNTRYRESPGPNDPSPLLTAFAYLLPTNGRALDLASGNGRHSVWLAERGLEIAALDISSEALRLGRELAERRGCSVHWLPADAETFELGTSLYDVIVCFNFRMPTLYSRIQRALRPDGWLVYETYTLELLQYDAGPRDPKHLLKPGELLAAFAALRIAYYREAQEPRAVASLIAQKMAGVGW